MSFDETAERYRFSVFWLAAGCLPDSESPAFSANTLKEVRNWLNSDAVNEYWELTGENNTYYFSIVENLEE
jgi:asparagine N-glycosylation enzyme membrane subunit Stt3